MTPDFDPMTLIEEWRRKKGGDAARTERKRKKERILWAVVWAGHGLLLALVWVVFGRMAGLFLTSLYGMLGLGAGVMYLIGKWLNA